MASVGDYFLRNRHKSQFSTEAPDSLNMHTNNKADQPDNDSGLIKHPSSSPEVIQCKEQKKKEHLPKPRTKEPVIEMKDFQQVNMNKKLNLLMMAINKINSSFHHKFEDLLKKLTIVERSFDSKVSNLQTEVSELQNLFDDKEKGITPRMHDVEIEVSGILTRVDNLEEKVATMQNEMAILKGTVQVHEKQLTSNAAKITDLTFCSMANNVLITGLIGNTKEENCKEKVYTFFTQQLKMDLQQDDIIVAHRLGKKVPGKLRQMVVCCTHQLRKNIFANTKNLKDITNANGDYYNVKPQYPEPIATVRREQQEMITAIKKANSQEVEHEKKTQFELKSRILYVDGKARKQHIFPPTMKDIFNIDVATQNKMEKLVIKDAPPIEEKHSVFTGYALAVNNVTEIKLAYKRIKQLSPEADHIMMAYNIKNYSGYHDAGEHGARKRLQ